MFFCTQSEEFYLLLLALLAIGKFSCSLNFPFHLYRLSGLCVCVVSCSRIVSCYLLHLSLFSAAPSTQPECRYIVNIVNVGAGAFISKLLFFWMEILTRFSLWMWFSLMTFVIDRTEPFTLKITERKEKREKAEIIVIWKRKKNVWQLHFARFTADQHTQQQQHNNLAEVAGIPTGRTRLTFQHINHHPCRW